MSKLKNFDENSVNKVDWSKVDAIEKIKSILYLINPLFDWRKDDAWDMSQEEKIARGMFASMTITVGKRDKDEDGYDIFYTYLTTKLINPAAKVSESSFVVNDTVTRTLVCGIDFDYIKEISISDDNDSSCGWGDAEPLWNRYLIEFTETRTNLDYQIDLQLYTEKGFEKYKHQYI